MFGSFLILVVELIFFVNLARASACLTDNFLEKVILNKGKLINRFPNLDKWSRKKITNIT